MDFDVEAVKVGEMAFLDFLRSSGCMMARRVLFFICVLAISRRKDKS